jgi:hypothetical protein
LQTSKLILDFEFDQHLESHKHVISIIMRFRDTGCYSDRGCLGRRGPRAGNRRNSGWVGGTRVGDGALVCGGWSWWWRWR